MIREDLEPFIDPSVWELLYTMPVAAGAGACACNDQRGSNRYIYYLFSATSFWRFDTLTSAWQQLANPLGHSRHWHRYGF